MKISVITATWNSANTISDTLDSISSQSYDDIEYIVVDGLSTDNTLEIIENHNADVNIMISEQDDGIYDALNKGIAVATGDVIGFLHSDDVYASSDALQKIADVFSHSKIDSVYSDLNYVSKNHTDKVIRHWRSNEYKPENILNGWMPPHPTFYLKREYYQLLGGFNLSYKIAADYDSILRYLWKNNLTSSYIPEVLINMRIGGESNRSFKNIVLKSKEDYRAMKNNGVPAVRALLCKNLSKIPQFFKKQ
jgi:glycosyltransferase